MSEMDSTSRQQLISLALEFVGSATHVPGVTRIALIGSLTTDKQDPKDVDLLVTVTDDADLAPLAAITRKLHGRAQSLNRSGDVFLTNEKGHYLGRVCRWKRCGHGIRQSCDALHCGRRSYLHDDLQTIKLSNDLIASPPIELWPHYSARVDVPRDLQAAIASQSG
jgi:hypothetical protein